MPSSPQSSTPALQAPSRLAPLTSTPPSSTTPTAASPSPPLPPSPPTPPTPTLRPGSIFIGCSTSAPPISFLSSSSPLSHIENLPSVPVMSPMLYKTPVKVEVEVEEDILVMDGVLVSDSDSGWLRLPVFEFGLTGSSFSSSFG